MENNIHQQLSDFGTDFQTMRLDFLHIEMKNIRRIIKRLKHDHELNLYLNILYDEKIYDYYNVVDMRDGKLYWIQAFPSNLLISYRHNHDKENDHPNGKAILEWIKVIHKNSLNALEVFKCTNDDKSIILSYPKQVGQLDQFIQASSVLN